MAGGEGAEEGEKGRFDWPDAAGALDKLSEEIRELRQAVADGTNVTEELGDLLFSAVNAARFLKADPEDALNAATDKFIRRFQQVEAQAAQAGRAMEDMTLAELDKLWENAKRT